MSGVTMQAIQAAVAHDYRLPVRVMSDRSLYPSHTGPRQVAMHLARQLTKHSLENIGRHFGGRDHTTVSHAVKTVEQRAANDSELAQRLAQIRAQLIHQSTTFENVVSCVPAGA